VTELPPLDLPPKLARTVNALRRVILETVPGVEERIYKGRTSAGYHDRQFGAFCGLFTTRDKVLLEFMTELPLAKGERLLNKGRFVSFAAGARVPKAPVKRILHAALMARA
jgi:hypothetical protein